MTALKRTLITLTIALTFSAMAQVQVKEEKIAEKKMKEVSTQQSINDFNWKHRLLVMQLTSEYQLQQLQDTIHYHNPDVKARKLVLLVQDKNKTYVLAPSTTKVISKMLASEQLSKSVANLLHKNRGKVLLIGLDGGIKQRYRAETFTIEQAFMEIDLMPMRRLEITGSS